VRRRDFLVGMGFAAAWPLLAGAQPSERLRRVGVLVPGAAGDTRYQTWIQAFREALAAEGWSDSNLQMDVRFGTDSSGQIRKHATELVARGPDVILAHGASTIRPLQQVTRSIPIVFPIVADPVGAGIVDSLTRPGGNVTGFMTAEYGMAGKWLELLKEVAPGIERTAVFRDPGIISGASQFAAVQAVSPYVKVEVTPLNVRSAAEIDSDVAEFARQLDGSLLITSGPGPQHFRELIITLASRHKLPAVYPERFYVSAGGLISYGVDYLDQYRRAAGYVNRILKGEKPADLPVQRPTNYELVINMKTTRVLGLTVPPTLLARADEVIE
jgi:putative tryptophan/tyrosine transport system substrate-binding protein